MRLAVGIEYAGTRYAGWQRQQHAPSIQAEVERALASVADHPVAVTCAGRTDAGVHALAQVAHFDTEALRPLRGWLLGANTVLPSDIALQWVAEVAPDFHARYTAQARTYRYLVLNRPLRAPLAHERVCTWRTPLDASRMQAALEALVGEHDFSAFRGAECQSRTPVRRMLRISVVRAGELVVFELSANAFLHHMVRNIVGSALLVGGGERDAGWLAEVLACRDRRAAGPTAPAGGLYLAAVDYPAAAGVPRRAPVALSAMIGPSEGADGSG